MCNTVQYIHGVALLYTILQAHSTWRKPSAFKKALYTNTFSTLRLRISLHFAPSAAAAHSFHFLYNPSDLLKTKCKPSNFSKIAFHQYIWAPTHP
jgi:hypothetical protein